MNIEALAGLTFAALIAVCGGLPIQWLFRRVELAGARPNNVSNDVWNALEQPQELKTSGHVYGALERLIALAAAWLNSFEVIAGWLAFKVASKWEVWSHVQRLPESLNDIPDVDYLRTRRAWGSRMFMRFLIGTAVNLLIGFGSAYIGREIGTLALKLDRTGYVALGSACLVIGLGCGIVIGFEVRDRTSKP